MSAAPGRSQASSHPLGGQAHCAVGADTNVPDQAHAPGAASFGRSLKTVAWSFLGIRKSAEFQQDLARVNPMHIIVVGIVGVLALVVGLIVLVNWVVAK